MYPADTNLLIAVGERFLVGIPSVLDLRVIHLIYVILFSIKILNECLIDAIYLFLPRSIDMTLPKLIPTRCVWLSLLTLSPSLHAQTLSSNTYPPVQVVDSPLEYRQFEKVEITGSSIVRKEQTQALPVQVITREDIRRTGLKTITEVVQALPIMGNFVETSQIGMVAGGYSSAGIHGMTTGTLVLVDGLRLAPFGRATMVGAERVSVDLSTLPLADIERIEVLTDGASSLYGTDAIAGVVNIILRKERKGFEITADYLRPGGGAGQGWVSSIGWGQGQLARDGYSLMVTAEVSKRQELLGKDRPYASAAQYEFETGGQRYTTRSNIFYSIFTSPAALRERAPNANSAGRFVNPVLARMGACHSRDKRPASATPTPRWVFTPPRKTKACMPGASWLWAMGIRSSLVCWWAARPPSNRTTGGLLHEVHTACLRTQRPTHLPNKQDWILPIRSCGGCQIYPPCAAQACKPMGVCRLVYAVNGRNGITAAVPTLRKAEPCRSQTVSVT
jgi:hypothetical protein